MRTITIMLRLFLWMLFVVIVMNCSRKDNNNNDTDVRINKTEPVSLPTSAFKSKLESTPDAVVIDVRKPEEIEKGIIANAVNIDFTDPSFEEKISALDRKKPYFVYCKSGKRSTGAVEQMGKLGFETVYVLEGGLNQWQEEGNETVIP